VFGGHHPYIPALLCEVVLGVNGGCVFSRVSRANFKLSRCLLEMHPVKICRWASKTRIFTMPLQMLNWKQQSTLTYIYNGPRGILNGWWMRGTPVRSFLSHFHGPEGWWQQHGDTSKHRFSHAAFVWWATIQQQYTSIHLGVIFMYRQHNDWAILNHCFWWRETIIVIFASVLSLELFFTAILLDREHRGHPC
jgi:hypothetical protein